MVHARLPVIILPFRVPYAELFSGTVHAR